MANKIQLSDMQLARAGDPIAQLSLAKRYLKGEAGLAKNMESAAMWLVASAQSGIPEAESLLVEQVPLEQALRHARPNFLTEVFRRQLGGGNSAAGLPLAKLLVANAPAGRFPGEARHALTESARAGDGEAAWLLLKDAGIKSYPEDDYEAMLMELAAKAGIREAANIVADNAWRTGRRLKYLGLKRVDASHLLQRASQDPFRAVFSREELETLYRCALAMFESTGDGTAAESMAELAADRGLLEAQLFLGYWNANLSGPALAAKRGRANYPKALAWLGRAYEQGSGEAAYLAYQLYLNAANKDRNLAEAQAWLAKAARLGHARSQAVLGERLWRTRKEHQGADVEACYWLCQAVERGDADAADSLTKIARAPSAELVAWADELTPHIGEIAKKSPLLAARIEIAAAFGLTESEAVRIDIASACQPHCLVVDVAASFKRRLIPMDSEAKRTVIDKWKPIFSAFAEGESRGSNSEAAKRLQQLWYLKRKYLS